MTESVASVGENTFLQWKTLERAKRHGVFDQLVSSLDLSNISEFLTRVNSCLKASTKNDVSLSHEDLLTVEYYAQALAELLKSG